jgi:hypothetical protein
MAPVGWTTTTTTSSTDPHCAEVHRSLDDVVVVLEAEQLDIHRLHKRPRVLGVLLGEKVAQDDGAVLELLGERLLLGLAAAVHAARAPRAATLRPTRRAH